MHETAKATVLIIDNDEGVVRAIATRLECLGYRCVTAATGAQGAAAFAAEPIDLVVTDLRMPVLSGVHLIEALRGYSDVPIIIVTGCRGDYDDQVRRLHDVSVVEKPFAARELVEMVMTRVGRRRLRRAG